MKVIHVFLIFLLLLSGCNTLQENDSTSSVIVDTPSEIETEIIDRTEKSTGLLLLDEDIVQTKDANAPIVIKTYIEPYCDNEDKKKIIQIEDDGASFIIKMYIKTYSDIEKKEFAGGIRIENAETSDIVYDNIWVPRINWRDDWRGISKEIFDIELIDVDFDGNKDIKIYGGDNGNWNKFYFYVVWNADTGNFADDPYNLDSLGLPSFDEEKQLIYSMERGSAADHWYYTHKYIDGVLTLIEEVADNAVWEYSLDDSLIETLKEIVPLFDSSGITLTHWVKKQLDTDIMDMVVVEEKYVLYKDGNLFEEYDIDSVIGMKLSQLLQES